MQGPLATLTTMDNLYFVSTFSVRGLVVSCVPLCAIALVLGLQVWSNRRWLKRERAKHAAQMAEFYRLIEEAKKHGTDRGE
jgi:Flp pilus assembly protein TadB